jgi:protein-S-isoprenylcysteine O-methyltransferase Ste14
MIKDGWKAYGGQVLDSGERVIVAVLYAYFVYNITADVIERGDPFGLILLFSESAVLVITVFRRPTSNITTRPLDWILGFAGTTAALLVMPVEATPLVSPFFVAFLMVGGAGLQITSKLYLRRSFGIVAANRGIKVDGPYRLIRHPMYAGYILTQLGFLIYTPTARNLAVYSLCWALQIGRMIVEERLLLQDEAYRALVARVPYRLIPRVF